MAQEYVSYIVMNAVPKVMTLTEIQVATKGNPTLQSVKAALQSGWWYKAKKPLSSLTVDASDLKSFEKLQSELTETFNGLILDVPQLLFLRICILVRCS